MADTTIDAEEASFLGIINGYRAQGGAPALAVSPDLSRAAAWMVTDMGATGYFGHTDSLGRSPWTRMADCGYPDGGGENLAAGTNRSAAAGAFELFRNSPSHNENMLVPEFRYIGIARVHMEGSKYSWYWATTFAYGAAPPPPAPAAPPAPPAAAPAQPAAAAAPSAPAVSPREAIAPQKAQPISDAVLPATAPAEQQPDPEPDLTVGADSALVRAGKSGVSFRWAVASVRGRLVTLRSNERGSAPLGWPLFARPVASMVGDGIDSLDRRFSPAH